MKKFYIISKYTVILCCILLLATSLESENKIIRWESLGQEVILKKNDRYWMKYGDSVSSDWTYIELEELPEDPTSHKLILRTHSVARPDTVMLPDTIVMPCSSSGEMDFGYTGMSSAEEIKERSLRSSRTIILNRIGQTEEVKFCEKVALVYHNIKPEDCEIVYEQGPDSYFLELIDNQRMAQINFTCVCQKFYYQNPWMKQIVFSEELRYEQIIMTPLANGMWEVRIGTTDRGCKSTALQNLPKLRTREYEKNLPKCK